MSLCVASLYKTFPEIKAFGCCHEVFGTQKLLGLALEDIKGIQGAQREDIRVNVVGINHFTWLTAAQYKNMDLFPIYREFALKYRDEGFGEKADENLRYATLGFEEGVIPASNVLEAHTAWLSAQSEKIDAQIDVKLTEIYLKKATGSLRIEN